MKLPGQEQERVRWLLQEMQGARDDPKAVLKAVSRKRMKVIYTIMRDKVSYMA